MPKRSSVEDYFDKLDAHQRPHLETLRKLSLDADPEAVEAAGFEAGAGFIKLPYGRALPTNLLKALMQARLEEYEDTGAGWSERVRSYSMNAMVGDAGALSQTGTNVNNPSYKQFFRLTDIPKPSSIFVFLDEHPDSINDAGFFNPNQTSWIDQPANYHNAAAGFSFADGHAEIHKWKGSNSSLRAQKVKLSNAIDAPAKSAVHESGGAR